MSHLGSSDAILAQARGIHARAKSIVKRRNRDAIELARLLLRMEEESLAQALGFASVVDYAEKELEQSRSETKQLVALARKLRENEQLRAAADEGEIGWTKLR